MAEASGIENDCERATAAATKVPAMIARARARFMVGSKAGTLSAGLGAVNPIVNAST